MVGGVPDEADVAVILEDPIVVQVVVVVVDKVAISWIRSQQRIVDFV